MAANTECPPSSFETPCSAWLLRMRAQERDRCCALVPPVADQRLLLAADQHEERADDAEHEPGRRGENIERRQLPRRGSGIAGDQHAQCILAGGMEVVPVLTEPRDEDRVAGDRLGAVANQGNES